MKIALTSVSVPDPVAAFKFYTEVLGFKEKVCMPEMRLMIVVSPDDEQGTALLLEPNDHPGTKAYFKELYDSGIPVIVFSTADIQAEFERLKALGVEFHGEPSKTPHGTIVKFDDTCGNFIQLHQPL